MTLCLFPSIKVGGQALANGQKVMVESENIEVSVIVPIYDEEENFSRSPGREMDERAPNSV